MAAAQEAPATDATGVGAGVVSPAKELDDSSFLTLQFDNDMFGGSDRHFTHGMRAAWLSREGGAPRVVRQIAAKLPLFASSERMRIGYSIGQNIFTPDDIRVPDPAPEQRPYAGWLYGGLGLVSEHGDRLDKLELELGVVGPYSLAEQIQTNWHRLVSLPRPRGWDTQLKNEPGVVLYYERSWRRLAEFPRMDIGPFTNFGADFTPHLGGALGNVFTYAAGGFTLRFGQDLRSDYGPPKIRPNLPGSDFFQLRNGFGWYLFGGVEGRLVARNIFLDGNTFASSRSVDKIPAVADFQLGATVSVDRYRLSYTQVFRSPEFHGQRGFDSFGSVALSIRF